MRESFKFGILVIGLAVLAGCSSEEPSPFGNMKGKVEPATSAHKVFLAKGSDTLHINLPADGSFEVNDLQAGWYNLGTKPSAGYMQATPQRILITGGQTMQARTIKLEPYPENGLLTLTLDDKEYKAPLSISRVNGSKLSAEAGGYTIQLELPKITAADSFNTATNSQLKLLVSDKDKTYQAYDTLGQTALKVTSFDPVTRRGYARFSFTAGKTGEKKLEGKNGTLQYIKFR